MYFPEYDPGGVRREPSTLFPATGREIPGSSIRAVRQTVRQDNTNPGHVAGREAANAKGQFFLRSLEITAPHKKSRSRQ